ncbi:glutaminase GtaA [Lepidopterella palustris CBS 459.81]|uniref:Glutaminase GtaA n=1 Tax=Lepidopterella palustris CBS 459.81 TaxID=1314670 RepID=A0A8E2JEJ8_9PEZI|nr:glutaminase GtaA [Lepidopterella palustris CBS 459.81]
MDISYLGLLLAFLINFTRAISTFSPARPPSLPLAVKSPYLSTWLDAGRDGGNGGYLPGQWPQFWTNQVTGWTGLIRVDGTTYTWMGNPIGPALAEQVTYEYTSTKSIFTIDVAGKLAMNITFLSPITPDDMMRQSLVFSYMNVEVTSMDGTTHDVQLYSDISAGQIAYHHVFKQDQALFSENDDQAEWGDCKLTHQSGIDKDVRGAFTSNGKLGNTNDTNYRAINNQWPVFGFSVDLGKVGTYPVDTLFSLGLCQTQAVQFAGNGGTQALPSLWTSFFTDERQALSFFHQDYSTSLNLSTDFDQRVARDSVAAAGQNYLTITSLSARQAFGATQLVGSWSSKYYLFLKEISSDGNVQTVDVVFPAFPFFLYANPTLLKLLLDPLFENQEAGLYSQMYSMHDLGTHYPNGTGHPAGDDEYMPVEECGNMLLMTLAYAQQANDIGYLIQHYPILHQWNEYLVNYSLYPAFQVSTDDFAGSLANQTNLALKGIIGIAAMAEIAHLTGNHHDAGIFTNISYNFINTWQSLAISKNTYPPHTTLSYGDEDSNGLLYNLYSDKLLSLNLVPSSVYDMQSAFYGSSGVAQKYGVPLDTRHNYTKGDWEIWTAAISDESTRDMFIQKVATWISETPTQRALTDLYDTISGDWPIDGPQFASRPVMGGTFALLALP